MNPEPIDPIIALLCILAYVLAGVLVALMTDRLSRNITKWGINAEGLTAISMFWPMYLPDLLYRLIAGKYWGET